MAKLDVIGEQEIEKTFVDKVLRVCSSTGFSDRWLIPVLVHCA